MENKSWHDLALILDSALQITETLTKWKDHKIITSYWKVISGWRYLYS